MPNNSRNPVTVTSCNDPEKAPRSRPWRFVQSCVHGRRALLWFFGNLRMWYETTSRRRPAQKLTAASPPAKSTTVGGSGQTVVNPEISPPGNAVVRMLKYTFVALHACAAAVVEIEVNPSPITATKPRMLKRPMNSSRSSDALHDRRLDVCYRDGRTTRANTLHWSPSAISRRSRSLHQSCLSPRYPPHPPNSACPCSPSSVRTPPRAPAG